jgi:hypothetical protein
MTPRQFDFRIAGLHENGRPFLQEFLVVAVSEAEALAELQVCLDCYEPVDSWRIESGPSVSDLEPGDPTVSKYEENGAFSVYDPAFKFL